MKYTLIIERGSEAYWGYFPDVPGCTTAGETIEQVVANASESLAGHLDGEAAPLARSLSQILVDPDVAENLDGSELFATVDFHEAVAAL